VERILQWLSAPPSPGPRLFREPMDACVKAVITDTVEYSSTLAVYSVFTAFAASYIQAALFCQFVL
jgi:hypothetical protein